VNIRSDIDIIILFGSVAQWSYEPRRSSGLIGLRPCVGVEHERLCIYILKSSKNNRYYIGSTIDVNNRLQKHNKGLVYSTKNNRPYKIELIQEYETITKAKQIEYKIKKLKRREYIEKMIIDKYIKLGR